MAPLDEMCLMCTKTCSQRSVVDSVQVLAFYRKFFKEFLFKCQMSKRLFSEVVSRVNWLSEYQVEDEETAIKKVRHLAR